MRRLQLNLPEWMLLIAIAAGVCAFAKAMVWWFWFQRGAM